MSASLEAKRRQVTVLFFDLVGSTALAERLDPEDLQDVLRLFQKATASRAQEHGGYVLDTPGDGFAVLFGYPLALEDAARRAVQAGLDIVKEVSKLELDPALGVDRLRVRVGIEAGEVVLGRVSEYDTRGKAAPTGRAPIVATRIQGVAEPGTVAVGPIAHELIRHRFLTESTGRHRLKGIEGEVEVFRAVAARSPGMPRTPLVGRERELGKLRQLWDSAVRGFGKSVVVSGVPGIGKTRLCEALLESVTADQVGRCLEMSGSRAAQLSTFEPVVLLMRRLLAERAAREQESYWLGVNDEAVMGHDDGGSASPSLLELLPEDLPDAGDKAAALALLLDLPARSQAGVLGLSSERRLKLTQEAATDLLFGLATDSPLLLVVEDVDWLDQATLEVVRMLSARVEGKPVLIVLTHRSDFALPADFPGTAELRLLPLSGEAGTSLARNTAQQLVLAAETVRQIVSRSDGVPLHIRELTAMALPTGTLPTGAVPETLKGLLIARVQATGEASFDVALTATVIGRTFDREVLERVLEARGVGRDRFKGSLDRLLEAGLIEYGEGTSELRFSHALIHDYAYAALGRDSTPIHGHVADALLETGGIQRWAAEEIARHFEKARRFVESAKHWELAGRTAARRSNLDQCIEFYRRALNVLGMDGDREAPTLECGLRLRLAAMLGQARGWGTREIAKILEPALEVARRGGDARLTFHLLTSLHTHLVTSEQRAECEALTSEQLDLAVLIDQPLFHGRAHLNAILTHWFLARTTEAVSHVEPALAALPAQDADSLGERIWCLIYASQPLWAAGKTSEARRAVTEAIELSKPLANPFQLADAYLYGSVVLGLMREYSAFETHITEALRISRKAGFTLMLSYADALLAWLRVRRGEEAALGGLLESWEELGRLSEGYRFPYIGMLYADALRRCGRSAEARARATELSGYSLDIRELCYVPELYRLRGVMAFDDGEADEARDLIGMALRLSREAGSAALELRAATTMAGIALATGTGRDESRKSLAAVVCRFQGEPDTEDLRDAVSALNALGTDPSRQEARA